MTAGLIKSTGLLIGIKNHFQSMKLIYLFLISLISLQSSGQTRQDSIQNAFQFVDSLLTPGNHEYQLMDFIYPQEILDISAKMQNAVAANRQWWIDYIQKHYVAGNGVPYDPHFGISEEEYNKIKQIDSIKPEKKVLKAGQIVIKKVNGQISLFSPGDYHVLDYIRINVSDRYMVFEKDTIPFDQAMNVPNNKMQGPFQGFSWTLFTTNQPDHIVADKLTSKNINLIFAIINSGQKFIRVKYVNMIDGKPIANADLCFYLN
jgi:hypothetical protein